MWEMIDNYIWIALLVFVVITFILPKLLGTSKKTAEQTASVFSGRHEFQVVTPQAFPGKKLDFYESTQRFLEGQGFRWVGDIEDLTLTKTHPNMRTFIRCMISADGTITGGIYDVELKGWMKILQLIGLLPRKLQVLDLETEFNDGTFLCTSNSKDLDQLDAPPSIRKIQYPQPTDLMDLLNVHRGVMTQWTEQDANYLPLKVYSLEDGLEAQHRMQDLQNAFRKQVGLLTRDEARRMAGGHMTHAAEEILREHHKLASGELQVHKPDHHEDR